MYVIIEGDKNKESLLYKNIPYLTYNYNFYIIYIIHYYY